MDGQATGGTLRFFRDMPDPRAHNVVHKLHDILVIAICAVICGADGWAEVEVFGNSKLAWFRTFLDLPGGVPSHDTFGRVFARLDPAQLMACVRQWIVDLNRDIGQHIAIDGKTLRGSHDKAAGRNPLHLVSAWSSEARLTLGQIAVDCKSNEITAIPLLLDLLDLGGATVTIDAMGCQKEIAAEIIAGGGNYVLALSADHGVAEIPELAGSGGRLTAKEVKDALEKVFVPVLGIGDHVAANAYTDIYLTPKTVSHQLSAIYTKLGVETRTEAAHAASQLGIVTS